MTIIDLILATALSLINLKIGSWVFFLSDKSGDLTALPMYLCFCGMVVLNGFIFSLAERMRRDM